MRSTCPFARGWATEAYLTSMQELSQKSQKDYDVKLEPRSVMMVWGNPNRWMMSEMKSTALSEDILAMGLYSIHLVNLSTATSTWLNPPGATVRGPIMSRLQQANSHDGEIVIRLCAGMWVFLPKNWQPGHHLTRSSASKIAVGQKNTDLYALPTSVLHAAWLPQTPSCISRRMSLPSSRVTHFMRMPEAERLYRLSPTITKP